MSGTRRRTGATPSDTEDTLPWRSGRPSEGRTILK
jgi:hypothetical protein